MSRELFAGVMSGTSLDGVDAVVADFAPPSGKACETLGASHIPLPTMLRDELLALQTPGANELVARRRGGERACRDLTPTRSRRALADAKLKADAVIAAGVHGQTLRHRPERGFTLQLNNPARVAERAGVAVVADFRSRDVAAGGQGAPLVPAFHAALFSAPRSASGDRQPRRHREHHRPPGRRAGARLRHRSGQCAVSTSGARATAAIPSMRKAPGPPRARSMSRFSKRCCASRSFPRKPPKSTDRDKFNLAWLEEQLKAADWKGEADDVQATLIALTARTIADAIREHASAATEVLACGGGARNATLMKALAAELKPRRRRHDGRRRACRSSTSKRSPSRGSRARRSPGVPAICPTSPAPAVPACWAPSTRASAKTTGPHGPRRVRVR